MRIIKLDATDSTNAYLKNAMQTEVLDDFTVVIAKNQFQGKGQFGAEWSSEPGKNLTISILKKFNTLIASKQFLLNMVVSIAVYETLKGLQISNVAIKWPNDILSGNEKICGILIENVIREQYISSSIIGIGLNVNQKEFPGLERVTSMALRTPKIYPIEEVLMLLLTNLKRGLEGIEANNFGKFKAAYERLLFKKDRAAEFSDISDQSFKGYIRGVSDEGKLIIEDEHHSIQEYDLKQLKMLY